MTAVAARAQRPGTGLAGRGRAGLAGTAALISLALRRDRIFLPVWLYIFAGSIGSTGYSFRHLYTSLAERVSLTASCPARPLGPRAERAGVRDQRGIAGRLEGPGVRVRRLPG